MADAAVRGTERDIDCKDKIAGIVNFVTGNLRPVKSDIDIELSSWYKENSRVYVAGDHACWSDFELKRKVHKRRFGTVVRSDEVGLNRMMQAHAAEAQDWIRSRMKEAGRRGDTTEEEDGEEEEAREKPSLFVPKAFLSET